MSKAPEHIETTLPPVKTYAVKVDGFPELIVHARTPARARADCWHQYRCYDNDCTFMQFLRMSTLRRAATPLGIGERIFVAGLPAVRVGTRGQYVAFMRDDSHTVLLSHPADVSAATELSPA